MRSTLVSILMLVAFLPRLMVGNGMPGLVCLGSVTAGSVTAVGSSAELHEAGEAECDAAHCRTSADTGAASGGESGVGPRVGAGGGSGDRAGGCGGCVDVELKADQAGRACSREEAGVPPAVPLAAFMLAGIGAETRVMVRLVGGVDVYVGEADPGRCARALCRSIAVRC